MNNLYLSLDEIYPFPIIDTEHEEGQRLAYDPHSASRLVIEGDEETLQKLYDKYNELMSVVNSLKSSSLKTSIGSSTKCDVPSVGSIIIKRKF